MKLYKVTQNQYKTLQQSGSIVVGGVTYTYNEDDIYVITDPWAPEYRLSWDFAEKELQITKDGEVVSQIGIDYAVMANHANTAAAILADGTQVQASELKATVNEFASHKKDSSNPHSVTKAQVGLGNVVNTGQTATPTSGSNSYFTAGGAYTLQQSLNNSIEDATLQANQQWGGQDISGSLSPVEAVATPMVGANKLAFCNPEGVTIEYSTDGGGTWHDYQASEWQIVNFFNDFGSSFKLGKKESAGSKGSVQDKLRITLDATTMGVYFRIKRLLVNVSIDGADGLYVNLEKATIGEPDTFTSVRTNIPLNGWPGWNSFDVWSADIFGGNNTQTTQTRKIRLTFGITGTNPSYSSAAVICAMAVLCDAAYTTNSNLAANGHLYSYDWEQNAYFPANVTIQGLKNAAIVGTDANGRLGPVSGNLFLYDDLGSI